MNEDGATPIDPLLIAGMFVVGLALFSYGAWHRWTLRGRPAKTWRDAMTIGAFECLLLFSGGMLIFPVLMLMARVVGLR
jgi:hypothetical protein